MPQDLVFTYRRSDGRFVSGEVEYVNDGIDNTLVLQVDPTDGKVRIINDSTFNVAFDGYRVRSASNSLNPNWNSLDDQNVGGPNGWLEALPTNGVLSELNPLGSLAVPAGAATAAVMNGLFNFASGTQDLVFDFRIPAGGGLPNSSVLNGIVLYAPFNLGLAGDFNGDGGECRRLCRMAKDQWYATGLQRMADEVAVHRCFRRERRRVASARAVGYRIGPGCVRRIIGEMPWNRVLDLAQRFFAVVPHRLRGLV